MGCLRKRPQSTEMKTEFDLDRRKQMLAGAFIVDGAALRDRDVLLIDDLVRSGATLQAAAEACRSIGRARSVAVLAVTYTRVLR